LALQIIKDAMADREFMREIVG